MNVTGTYPDHLLTYNDWTALPEDNTHRYELAEGVLLVAPRPAALHQWVVLQLCAALNAALPAELAAIPDFEVVLEMGTAATVRVPDVIVTSTKLVEDNQPRVHANQVYLAVEVISPGTRRTDRLVKPAEYADAGISQYWVVDLDPPPSLAAYQLQRKGAYAAETETGTGTLSLPGGRTVDVNLDALIRR